MHSLKKTFKSILVSILIACSFYSFSQDTSNTTNMSQSTYTLDFTNDLNLERKNWLIVNDSVMGGRTFSEINLDEGQLKFTGVVSLKNNGGFASVRRRLIDNETDKADVVKLVIKGDGRAYKIRFRLNGYLDGLAYEQSIQTKENIKETFILNEQDFKAVYRSRTYNDAQVFDLQDALQFEIMLADKNEGEFSLELNELSFEFEK